MITGVLTPAILAIVTKVLLFYYSKRRHESYGRSCAQTVNYHGNDDILDSRS